MENKSFSKMVKDELLIKKVKKQDNNLLKNLFIKSGSMNDPNNKYHFEIAFTELKDAEESQIVLQNNNIKSKITKKCLQASIQPMPQALLPMSETTT